MTSAEVYKDKHSIAEFSNLKRIRCCLIIDTFSPFIEFLFETCAKVYLMSTKQKVECCDKMLFFLPVLQRIGGGLFLRYKKNTCAKNGDVIQMAADLKTAPIHPSLESVIQMFTLLDAEVDVQA